MKTVIIVNGRPRAGKDTAIQTMTNILTANGIATESFSSIDPVRKMLGRAGFDLAEKTPQDRALMAEVGDAVEKHSQWRSQRSFAEICSFFDIIDERDGVMFLHVREPYLIERIGERIRRRGWSLLHVLIKSVREEHVTSNAADMGVEDMRYDVILENNGTLDDLARACDRLLFKSKLISQLSLLHR